MFHGGGTSLNALKRQSKFIVGMKNSILMANSYVLSYFNYCPLCPLVWHFCGAGSTHKIEKIHERALTYVDGFMMTMFLLLFTSKEIV